MAHCFAHGRASLTWRRAYMSLANIAYATFSSRDVVRCASRLRAQWAQKSGRWRLSPLWTRLATSTMSRHGGGQLGAPQASSHLTAGHTTPLPACAAPSHVELVSTDMLSAFKHTVSNTMAHSACRAWRREGQEGGSGLQHMESLLSSGCGQRGI